MKTKRYYRVFEVKKDAPHSIFHGTQGSRMLPLNKWIEADVKDVTDGSGTRVYKSGFHVMKDLQATTDFFLKMFKKFENRVIVPVTVDESAGIWRKERARGEVFLAKKIRIDKRQWKKRIYLDSINTRS